MLKNEHIIDFSEIKQGNEAVFKQMYEEYYTPLCFFADKYINDFDQSRSTVQGVFVKIWIQRDKLNINYSVKNYLFNSVKNASIDYLRKQKSQLKLWSNYQENDTNDFEDLIETAELNSQINGAIQALPEKCREIFILCKFDELKYAEVAIKLGISVKTVEMQMGIALKKLRDKLSAIQYLSLVVFLYYKK